jgi:hypothetical protein
MAKGMTREEQVALRSAKTAAKKAAENRRTQDAEYMKKTAVGGKKAPEATVYAAGSNVLARPNKGKAISYDDALKKGTRADDPRNWEHYYKGSRMVQKWSGGKGGDYKTVNQGFIDAFNQARRTGQDVYDVKKLQWETEQIKGETKQAAANRKATSGGGFRSSRVAQNVVAQKQMANRKTGRAKASSPFEARTKNRVGIA